MANTKKAKDVLPAVLADNEPMISKDMAIKYEKHVEKFKDKENHQQMIKSVKKPPAPKKSTSLKSAGDNAIGSAPVEQQKKPSAKAGPKKATVAIYSDRNVSWNGVGKISRGYNIVTPQQAEQWLTRKHVREATPEEVASEFGV
jgi:hypothetical protein